MTLVLECAEKAPGDAAEEAVPRMRKGSEYPVAFAAPLMPGLEAHGQAGPSPHWRDHLKGERAKL
jgi:hypothetical protein